MLKIGYIGNIRFSPKTIWGQLVKRLAKGYATTRKRDEAPISTLKIGFLRSKQQPIKPQRIELQQNGQRDREQTAKEKNGLLFTHFTTG